MMEGQREIRVVRQKLQTTTTMVRSASPTPRAIVHASKPLSLTEETGSMFGGSTNMNSTNMSMQRMVIQESSQRTWTSSGGGSVVQNVFMKEENHNYVEGKTTCTSCISRDEIDNSHVTMGPWKHVTMPDTGLDIVNVGYKWQTDVFKDMECDATPMLPGRQMAMSRRTSKELKQTLQNITLPKLNISIATQDSQSWGDGDDTNDESSMDTSNQETKPGGHVTSMESNLQKTPESIQSNSKKASPQTSSPKSQSTKTESQLTSSDLSPVKNILRTASDLSPVKNDPPSNGEASDENKPISEVPISSDSPESFKMKRKSNTRVALKAKGVCTDLPGKEAKSSLHGKDLYKDTLKRRCAKSNSVKQNQKENKAVARKPSARSLPDEEKDDKDLNREDIIAKLKENYIKCPPTFEDNLSVSSFGSVSSASDEDKEHIKIFEESPKFHNKGIKGILRRCHSPDMRRAHTVQYDKKTRSSSASPKPNYRRARSAVYSEEAACYSLSEGEDEVEDFSFEADPIQHKEFLKNDKLYNVAYEILTTEEKYVEKIGIILKIRDDARSIMSESLVKKMFPEFPAIYELHKDFLLPYLKKRIQDWKELRQIGDIMLKFAPFLKVYTPFIKTFNDSTSIVDEQYEKSKAFAKIVDSNCVYNGDPVKLLALMIEPVQRVPRYELLMKEYIKQMGKLQHFDDEKEKSDLRDALAKLSEVARHFESMLQRDATLHTLMGIQKQLEGTFNVVSPNRTVITQGTINRVSTTSGFLKPRYIFLFSDLLLICHENTRKSLTKYGGRYKVQYPMYLDNLQLVDGDNLDVPYTFYVKTSTQTVELAANSAAEMGVWQKNLKKAICNRIKQTLDHHKTRYTSSVYSRDQWVRSRGSKKRKQDPNRVRVSPEASSCMLCVEDFLVSREKKECPECGSSVCLQCSARSVLNLDSDPVVKQNVCDACYMECLEKESKKKKSTASEEELETSFGGFLQISSDQRKSWKRRYFLIHDRYMHVYKEVNDEHPLTSVSLATFTVHGIEDGTCLTLQNSNRCYYFKEGNGGPMYRWVMIFHNGIEKTGKIDLEYLGSGDSKKDTML